MFRRIQRLYGGVKGNVLPSASNACRGCIKEGWGRACHTFVTDGTSERPVSQSPTYPPSVNTTIPLFLPAPPISYTLSFQGSRIGMFTVFCVTEKQKCLIKCPPVWHSYQGPAGSTPQWRLAHSPNFPSAGQTPPREQSEETIYFHANGPLMGNEANWRQLDLLCKAEMSLNRIWLQVFHGVPASAKFCK